MNGADARGVARRDETSVVTASAAAKWLRFAAAPTFLIMALLTIVLDGGSPNELCTAAGSFWPGGMVPMYLLMGAFHLAPWLRLISRRENAARHADLDRSSCVLTASSPHERMRYAGPGCRRACHRARIRATRWLIRATLAEVEHELRKVGTS